MEDKVNTGDDPRMQQVGDPTKVKTKGAPKKKKYNRKKSRHCSNCSNTGLTVRRCPLLVRIDCNSNKDDGVSHSETSGSCAESGSEKDVMPYVETNVNERNAQETNCQDSQRDKTSSDGIRLQNVCSRQNVNVNKGKEKLIIGSKKKVKGALKPKQDKEMKIKSSGCSSRGGAEISQGHPVVPPVHGSTYPYARFNEGFSVTPNLCGGPIESQNAAIPIYNPNSHIPFYPQNSQPHIQSQNTPLPVYIPNSHIPFYHQNSQPPIQSQNTALPFYNPNSFVSPEFAASNISTSSTDL